MTPQMMANPNLQTMTHLSDMQNLDPSEIGEMLQSICSQLDPELLQATFS